MVLSPRTCIEQEFNVVHLMDADSTPRVRRPSCQFVRFEQCVCLHGFTLCAIHTTFSGSVYDTICSFICLIRQFLSTENKNSSGDEIANVNFLTTISHTRRPTSNYRIRDKPTSFNKLHDRQASTAHEFLNFSICYRISTSQLYNGQIKSSISACTFVAYLEMQIFLIMCVNFMASIITFAPFQAMAVVK